MGRQMGRILGGWMPEATSALAGNDDSISCLIGTYSGTRGASERSGCRHQYTRCGSRHTSSEAFDAHDAIHGGPEGDSGVIHKMQDAM